jgi:hypothetical protein
VLEPGDKILPNSQRAAGHTTCTYGLFITIPNGRLDPPSENVVMFAERPARAPKAIKVWFYPGDRTGEEDPGVYS